MERSRAAGCHRRRAPPLSSRAELSSFDANRDYRRAPPPLQTRAAKRTRRGCVRRRSQQTVLNEVASGTAVARALKMSQVEAPRGGRARRTKKYAAAKPD